MPDVVAELQLFQAIADAGGLSAAARVLGSSPPAMSRRLAELERRLGVKLADRSARRFRLTDEGARIWNKAAISWRRCETWKPKWRHVGGPRAAVCGLGHPPIWAAITSLSCLRNSPSDTRG